MKHAMTSSTNTETVSDICHAAIVKYRELASHNFIHTLGDGHPTMDTCHAFIAKRIEPVCASID